MITLPNGIVPAISDLTANNILFTGDYGIGKSGLLASTEYLLADPEDKLRSYPCQRVHLTNWQDHKDFATLISKMSPGTFKGIGLDSLNISYDHCLTWVMNNVKFDGIKITHPSEKPQTAYNRVTSEFITWLRSVTYLGYHVIATCHVSIKEVRSKNGTVYDRWIPAFTGGSSGSSYSSVLKVFSIIGFMTLETVERPPTGVVMGKKVVDTRLDASRIDTVETRVIYFGKYGNWLTNNKEGGFPDKVILNGNWRDDWKILQDSWGKTETVTGVAEEPVEGTTLKVVEGEIK